MWTFRLLLCLLCCSATFAWMPAAHAQEGEFNLRAAIREGACDDRGDRIAALEDPALSNGDEAGSRDGLSALISETTVEVAIEDLIEDDSIIAITREGESGVDACGAIGGVLTRRDVLTIQISEVDDSGVRGIAVLFPNDDDETTDVTLYLGGPGLAGAPEPEPIAWRGEIEDLGTIEFTTEGDGVTALELHYTYACPDSANSTLEGEATPRFATPVPIDDGEFEVSLRVGQDSAIVLTGTIRSASVADGSITLPPTPGCNDGEIRADWSAEPV